MLPGRMAGKSTNDFALMSAGSALWKEFKLNRFLFVTKLSPFNSFGLQGHNTTSLFRTPDYTSVLDPETMNSNPSVAIHLIKKKRRELHSIHRNEWPSKNIYKMA